MQTRYKVFIGVAVLAVGAFLLYKNSDRISEEQLTSLVRQWGDGEDTVMPNNGRLYEGVTRCWTDHDRAMDSNTGKEDWVIFGCTVKSSPNIYGQYDGEGFTNKCFVIHSPEGNPPSNYTWHDLRQADSIDENISCGSP